MKKMEFNAKGKERKKLAYAISNLVGQPVEYMGAPGFEYQIGSYTLSRDSELLYDDTNAYTSIVLIPTLVNMGFSVADESDLFAGLTIEIPANDFTVEAIERLKMLVASKAALIKKAVGSTSDLPIIVTETKICFPWFPANADLDETETYSRLVVALSNAAKKQKHVYAKERPVENEKYAFRVFLLRMGFIGADTKKARHILLKNLTGNAAWRKGRPPNHADKAQTSVNGNAGIIDTRTTQSCDKLYA